MENKFKSNLRAIRKKLKLTQVKFAKPLGIKGSAISALEKGKSNPTQSLLNLIEIKYRINRKWLLTGEGDPHIKGEGALGGHTIRQPMPDDPEGPGPSIIQPIPGAGDRVAAPDREYDKHGGWQPRKIKVSIEIKKTLDILESDSIYATALVANINAFHRALQDEQRMFECEQKLKDQSNEIDLLKKKYDELFARMAEFEEKEKRAAPTETQSES